MTLHMKNPTAGGAAGVDKTSLPGGNDNPSSSPKTAPAQENLLLEAIKALCAEEIRADTLENIPLAIAASGWHAASTLLAHAAQLIEAGDFLNAERTRQMAREQFITANDAWREFREAKADRGRAEVWPLPLCPRAPASERPFRVSDSEFELANGVQP
jgi:hypothetical protein